MPCPTCPRPPSSAWACSLRCSWPCRSPIVALVRTPAERLTLPRVAWVIIILLGELIGAIVFLAAGRRPAVDERAATVARPDAIEELYR